MRLDRHSGDNTGGVDGKLGSSITGAIASSCAMPVAGAHANWLANATHGKNRNVMKPEPRSLLMPNF